MKRIPLQSQTSMAKEHLQDFLPMIFGINIIKLKEFSFLFSSLNCSTKGFLPFFLFTVCGASQVALVVKNLPTNARDARDAG